jgi:hypothetical protein
MAQEPSPRPIGAAGAEDPPAARARALDRTARRGLWALPAWAVLLFLGTVTHQPDPRTAFAAFARYVTTPEFLLSHLVASITGAAIGVLGLLALFVFLALRGPAGLAAVGLGLAVAGNVLVTAVFGVAAFGQSAVGRLYLAGQTEAAVALYFDMYGAPLSATAAVGVVSLVVGVVALGIAVARARALPRWAGVGLAVGIVVFGVLGVLLADVVQSLGAGLLIASTSWLAARAWRAPGLGAGQRPRPG